MAEPTEPNQNAGNLDSRVGTLLQEALDAAGRVEAGLTTGASVEEVALREHSGQSITARNDEPTPPRHESTSAELSDIGQLDDDLAMLTESLISSETVSPGGASTATNNAVRSPVISPPPGTGREATAPAPVAAAESEITQAPTPPPAPGKGVDTAVAMGAAGAVRTQPIEARASSISTDSTTAPSPGTPGGAAVRAEPAKPRIQKADPSVRLAPALAKVAAGTAPVALAGFSAISKPLLSRPRIVRDTVGWLAVWTLFLAACVWVYILFVHKAAPPNAGHDAIHMVTADRAPVSASHGDEVEGGAHAKAEPAATSHAAPASGSAQKH